MIELIRTNSSNQDFIELVKLLDIDLAITDGDDHDFYSQFNKLDSINEVVVAYESKTAVGCGAIKAYNKTTMEVKRMFTFPECRGKGIAAQVLRELEKWAKELSFEKCILETGIRQESAIALYKKSGYYLIPNYGQYEGVSDSFCFEKML